MTITNNNCRECGLSFPIPRYNLGYRTCLSCGDKAAREVRFTVVPAYNKGAYQVVSPADLTQLNPKKNGG